jgi:hypothetical protein
MDESFRKVIAERFGMPLDGYPEMTSENARQMALSSLAEPDVYGEHILNKSWLLFEANAGTPFYISDNPVALQNEDKDRSPLRGNLGLAVRGIQIYLPISSTLTLAFFCQSHEMMIRDGVDRMRTSLVRDPAFPMDFGPMLDWMRAFRRGTPLGSAPDNVINHNSLQVMHAERWIFCSRPDFALVEEMIEKEPQFRIGPRLQMS